MPIQVRPDGPIPARVMVVGEAPGAEEEAQGKPFVGASGYELNRMLGEAGITRGECFVTNVARERPFNNDISTFIALRKKDITHEHTRYRDKWVKRPILDGVELLEKEIQMVKPNVIITLGNTPLWALTGIWGVIKWRGSMLHTSNSLPPVKLIPTIHPAAILREWSFRAIAINDLRRAGRFRNSDPYPDPKWNFIISPDFPTVARVLDDLRQRALQAPLRVSFDLETKHGHIDCAGLSWSLTEAICIPFMKWGAEGYWSEEEEAYIIFQLYKLLTNKNVHVVGQNLLYDSQYTYRHWHFIPNVVQDTMISHHVAFAGLRKSLDFQASMYCNHYVQWKPDKVAWADGK